MKAVRIFLLILILIGLVALVTQKIWVPKLVEYIISSENTPDVIEIKPQSNITLVDGRQCYTYNHKATASEPTTSNEFIDITIKGTKVTGTKNGNQNGPNVTDGYIGTLVGTLENNNITATFAYIVDGSNGKEKEIYRAGLTGIEKMRYPLKEGKGILVPDTTKAFTPMLYARVGCTASN